MISISRYDGDTKKSAKILGVSENTKFMFLYKKSGFVTRHSYFPLLLVLAAILGKEKKLMEDTMEYIKEDEDSMEEYVDAYFRENR